MANINSKATRAKQEQEKFRDKRAFVFYGHKGTKLSEEPTIPRAGSLKDWKDASNKAFADHSPGG